MPSPSESASKRDWRLYAQDMDRFARRAMGYCADLDRNQFETNQLIHAYLGVDLDVVWDVVQVELPLLIQQLRPLMG